MFIRFCRHTNGPKVTDGHSLSKLREKSLGHLSLKHIEYFLHWTSLLKLEEKAQMISSPLHALWTESEEKRYLIFIKCFFIHISSK